MSSPLEDAQATAAALSAERAWPVTITLAHPVEFGSETIESLTFRRGRMGDLKGISLDGVPPVDQLLMVASRMSGKPVKVIEMLEDEDGASVLELTLGFFARCLGAGRRP